MVAGDTGAEFHLFFHLFMRAKQLLLNLAVLGTLLLTGARQVSAQEDESWYKQRSKGEYKAQMSQVPAAQHTIKKQTTNNQRSACDFVVNGDMETQVQAPSHTGNMGGGGLRVPFASYSNTPDQLADWYSPTLGTPDFLATNAVNTVRGNDVNPSLETRIDGAPTVSGSSSVLSGIGEIGLYSRQAYNDGSADPPDRVSEYATVKLVPALTKAGYYAEMWVSLSHSTLSCNYGIDTGFGMWFTPNDNFKNLSSRDYLALPTSQFISNNSPIAEGDINNGVLGTTTWKRISGILQGNGENYVTIGAFNPNLRSQALQGKNSNLPNTYVFLDDFQIYKIPTAGSNVTVCNGSPATLGEGCSIPGATYTWSAPGITGLPTNSQNIQTTVMPNTTTIYTLTVNLPDGSSFSSSVRASVPSIPTIVQDVIGSDPCNKFLRYIITNFDPSFTYTVNILSGRVAALPVHPTTYDFRIKGGAGVTGGSFSITVSGCGTTYTTDEQFVSYDCDYNRTASETQAYPNPASESLTIPSGAESATLVNGQGNAVKTSDKSGKLDVQSLPDGLYNLQTRQNGKLINQRIQVKH